MLMRLMIGCVQMLATPGSGGRRRQGAMTQRPAEDRTVEPDERAHDRVRLLPAYASADEQAAEDRNERDGQERRARHRERLRERERSEELSFLAGQREH